jgi:hypothetical protein
MVAPPPLVPAFQFELANYASKMRALSTVWFIYGGISVVFGIIGMTVTDAFLTGHMGPWAHGPWAHHGMPPFWFSPVLLRFGWMYVIARAGLALMAGWGLMERASWGRIVAIIAAFVNIIKFPFGTALAIWTLVMLIGYRNATLYDQLPE